MSSNILDRYSIAFQFVKDSDGDKYVRVTQTKLTDLGYFISTYFINLSLEMFQYDILPELNKALNGEPFNEQGGGSITY